MSNLIKIRNIFIQVANIKYAIYYDPFKDILASQPNKESVIKVFFVDGQNPMVFEGEEARRLNNFLTTNSHNI